MTPPSLDNPYGVAAFPRSRRAVVCWVAFVALLTNVLLPTALSIGIMSLDPNSNTVTSGLCTATPGGGFPGKAKPGLLVHHCALCTLPVALPPRRQAGDAYEREVADKAHPCVRAALTPTPFRHGPVQARAPPIVS